MTTHKKKPVTALPTPAQVSRNGRKNSQNSPWRRMAISHKSAVCQEYFDTLAERGDTRRIPRPELDD